MKKLTISIECDEAFQFDKLVRLLVREDAHGFFKLLVVDTHRVQVIYCCSSSELNEVLKYSVIRDVVRRLNRLYDDVRLCDISVN